MNSEKIEILSKLVTAILTESEKLKAEVQRLNEKIEEMDAENRSVLERNLKAQTDLKKLYALEDSNRKMEKEKSAVRSKVNTLLENLEKMDFA
jgi:predicted  nucleic acid-binding Zn-ribbon protein